jgi:hypothetical protein
MAACEYPAAVQLLGVYGFVGPFQEQPKVVRAVVNVFTSPGLDPHVSLQIEADNADEDGEDGEDGEHGVGGAGGAAGRAEAAANTIEQQLAVLRPLCVEGGAVLAQNAAVFSFVFAPPSDVWLLGDMLNLVELRSDEDKRYRLRVAYNLESSSCKEEAAPLQRDVALFATVDACEDAVFEALQHSFRGAARRPRGRPGSATAPCARAAGGCRSRRRRRRRRRRQRRRRRRRRTRRSSSRGKVWSREHNKNPGAGGRFSAEFLRGHPRSLSANCAQ